MGTRTLTAKYRHVKSRPHGNDCRASLRLECRQHRKYRCHSGSRWSSHVRCGVGRCRPPWIRPHSGLWSRTHKNRYLRIAEIVKFYCSETGQNSNAHWLKLDLKFQRNIFFLNKFHINLINYICSLNRVPWLTVEKKNNCIFQDDFGWKNLWFFLQSLNKIRYGFYRGTYSLYRESTDPV